MQADSDHTALVLHALNPEGLAPSGLGVDVEASSELSLADANGSSLTLRTQPCVSRRADRLKVMIYCNCMDSCSSCVLKAVLELLSACIPLLQRIVQPGLWEA